MNIYILNATITGKILTEILCRQTNIKGIITLDDRGVEKTAEYHDYTLYCEANGLECIKLKTYNITDSRDKEILLDKDIDLLIVASWQRLIPEWLINKCSVGVIGCHGSHEGIELGRGRSPQNWALLTGQKQFILSIFWIEAGADNGKIIDTREFSYQSTDTILSSYIKAAFAQADMILENLRNGNIVRKFGTPQGTEVAYLPQRKAEDGMIDWSRDAIDIDNMVKALTKPYPGAYTLFNNEKIIIWISRPIVTDYSYLYDVYPNGTVISMLEESFLIKCGRNLLLVNECSNFNVVKEGTVFESANYQEQMKTIIARHNMKMGTPLSHLIIAELK